MQCSIEGYRGIKSNVVEAIKETAMEDGVLSYDGTSSDFYNTFLRSLAKSIKDPEAMVEALSQRVEALSSAFHNDIKRELSEELTVTDNEGKDIEYFLVDSTLRETDQTAEGVELVLTLGDVKDPLNTITATFPIGSDVTRGNIVSKQLEIAGLGDISSLVYRRMQNAKVSDVKNTAEKGSPEHSTIDKMINADRYLNSSQNRNEESLVGYEKVENYKHGDKESMREILHKLHVLGNEKANPEYMNYLNNLLDRMHPRFFREMTLFWKKTNTESFGEVRLDDNEIYVTYNDGNYNGVDRTEAEIYMHEVLHTMVGWALNSEHPKAKVLKTQLTSLIKDAQKHITYKDFLMVEEEVATAREIDQAKATVDYIFSSKNYQHEFIAFALTNPVMIKKLAEVMPESKSKKALHERIIDWLLQLFDLVLGKRGLRDNTTNAFDRVNSLAFKLAEINDYHQSRLSQMNPLGMVIEGIKGIDSIAAGYIKSINKLFPDRDQPVGNINPNEGVIATSKKVLKFGALALVSPTARNALGLWASSIWIKPTGTIREILGGFFEKNEQFRAAEAAKLLSDNLDMVRNGVISEASKSIKQAFKVTPTDFEEGALTTAFLETNASSLLYSRSGRPARSKSDLIQLYTDKDYRYEQIGRLKHLITSHLKNDGERATWTIQQAMGLGVMMATHENISITQIPNSHGIALGYGTETRYEKDKKLTALIGELAAINAIEYVESDEREAVAKLLGSEKDAINVISDMYEEYKTLSRKTIFKGKEAHIMEGHVAELFDATIDAVVRPVSEKAEMEAMGYVLRFPVTDKVGIHTSEPMAFYTTDSWGRAERLRGAVSIGRKHAKGTTLSELKRMENPALGETLFQRDLTKVKIEAIKETERMRNGEVTTDNMVKGMLPVFNANGVVTDYRYVMSKKQKRELLGQSLKVSETLPMSVARVEHQNRTTALNKEILETLKQDMAENWVEGEIGENELVEYSLIGPNATDPKMKELFYALPEEFREFIMSRADKTLAVRSQLIDIYFGRKEIQLTDLPGIKLLPKELKRYINAAEGIWQEAIKLSKTSILIKMPQVLASNILSNLWYLINTGSLDVIGVLKDHRDSWNELDEYLKSFKEASQLSMQIAADKEALRRVRDSATLSNIIEKKEARLKMLNRILENSDVKELFDAGYYQSNLLESSQTALSESNRITKYINSKLEEAPGFIKTGAELAYLTQNTAWYKGAQEVLQRSDMVARLVMNKRSKREYEAMMQGKAKLPAWWLEGKANDYPKKKVLTLEEKTEFLEKAKTVRMQEILDAFINYSLPSGPFEEYMNKMGLMMFTKYLKRVQTQVFKSAANHPVLTAMTLGIASGLMDSDVIHDSSAIRRLFTGRAELFGVVPMYGPFYHAENILTPALFKEEMLGRLI